MTQDEIKQAWEESTGSCWPDEGCFTAGEYDHHILSFAHRIRNAALEDAAKVAEYENEADWSISGQIARQIGRLKS